MEAIILAGGLGTRLRSMVDDAPKSMALINAKPFLEYQLDWLIANGVSRFILSVGYLSDAIKNHFSDSYRSCEIIYAIEKDPLGTGGAIKNAMKFVQEDDVLVANGDSLFLIDIQELYRFHKNNNADVTLSLKKMKNFERYGTVSLDEDDRIINFIEKKARKEGVINGGIYLFNVSSFRNSKLPEKFSIEKDFFEAKIDESKIFGFVSNGYFLDIGIPKDFLKAQFEIGVFSGIDKSWTLFLDRDGVINKKLDNDYVKSIEEFHLLPGALESIVNFSKHFGKVIVVTNQQGIGKKLMTEDDLKQIHHFLLDKVQKSGGTIHAFYHAPQLVSENSDMRKPNIGMALRAKKDFPEIDFEKSIMVGDSPSDIEFARRAKMEPVLITDQESETDCFSASSLNNLSRLLLKFNP